MGITNGLGDLFCLFIDAYKVRQVSFVGDSVLWLQWAALLGVTH